MPPFRIVLANSQILFLQSIAKNLKEIPGLELIGEFCGAPELLEFLEKSPTDLVILDVGSQHQIETVRKIKKSHPEIKILVLLMEKSKEFFLQAILSKADGYLYKENTYSDLTIAIKRIRQGGSYFCNIISGKMADIIRGMIIEIVPKELTAKQMTVLTLRCEMKSFKEIAELLSLKESIVRNYMANVKKKLNLTTQYDLMKYAIKQGYVQNKTGV